MAIDLLVDLPCPVKEVFPAAELIRRVKARDRAEATLAHARDEGDVREADAIFVRLVRADGEGGERTEETNLGAILRASEGLAALAHHCGRCPARLEPKPFGCYRSIGYPIARATEEFVMDRLPPVLGTVGGTFLVRAVKELGFDGAPVARMRAEGRTFFESDRPVACRWAEDEASWQVDSDQIWHMMLFGGPIDPRHALLLALVLGVAPHAAPPEDIRALLADREALAALLEPVFVPPPMRGTQLGDVALLLEAIRKSLVLPVTVLIDA